MEKKIAIDGVLFVYVVFKPEEAVFWLGKMFPVSVLGGNMSTFCVCKGKLCLVKWRYLQRRCSFHWHSFHLLRDWAFVVPFHSSSDFWACVSSVSFHTGYSFFPVSDHFGYCAICESRLILCDHSKQPAPGARSSSPIPGWWPNSPLWFLLLLVHVAFCFCPACVSFGWVDTHWSICAVLTRTPDSPGSNLLIDSAYLTYSWPFDPIRLHSLVACQFFLVIFHSCSRTIQHLEHFFWPCPIEVQTVDFAVHSLLTWWLNMDGYLLL